MKSKTYKNYFLGLLTTKEAEDFEIQILTDVGLADELRQAEDDLIEEYLDGSLSAEEIIAFNRNFLTTPDRIERVRLVKDLKNLSSENLVFESDSPSFFERLKWLFANRPFQVGLASLILILCLGIIWKLVNNSTNVANEQLIALNKRNLSNLDDYKNDKNLNLASGNLRSGGDSNSLTEKDLTEVILVRLLLPNSVANQQIFSVKISKNGGLMQSLEQTSVNENEVRILLPKSMLSKGDYQISLENKGEKYNYNFTVR